MKLSEHHLSGAIRLAVSAHAGQYDKSGLPYILHPLRVMEALRPFGIKHMIVGVLHDVVEDTAVTLNEIESSYGIEIKKAVDAITKREGEQYFSSIERVKQNVIARTVKKFDIADNTLFSRLIKLDDPTRGRIITKYKMALIILEKESD